MTGKMMRKRFLTLIACFLLLATSSFFVDATGHQKQRAGKDALGTPVLWREPSDIGSRNLYLGPGGEALKPDLSKVTLIEEKESAASAKFRVRDGSGREWIVKAGGEAQSEVAADRITWALGYFTDVTYFVPRVEIEGKGAFDNARFEARPKGIKRLDEWMWDDNPFLGKNELQGLKVLLVLLENWNLKNENNKVLFVRDDEAGTSELRYIVSDFDMKLDKTDASPSFWHKIRDNTATKPKFIEKTRGDVVDFGYTGKHKERLADISVAQAKWIGTWLARLSDQQFRDAFRAANYKPDEIQLLEKTVRARINELINLTR
jgi:hypothetical protein